MNTETDILPWIANEADEDGHDDLKTEATGFSGELTLRVHVHK